MARTAVDPGSLAKRPEDNMRRGFPYTLHTALFTLQWMGSRHSQDILRKGWQNPGDSGHNLTP